MSNLVICSLFELICMIRREEFSSCRQDMARLSQQLIKLKTESEEINNRKQDWQRENKEVAVLRMRLENVSVFFQI